MGVGVGVGVGEPRNAATFSGAGKSAVRARPDTQNGAAERRGRRRPPSAARRWRRRQREEEGAGGTPLKIELGVGKKRQAQGRLLHNAARRGGVKRAQGSSTSTSTSTPWRRPANHHHHHPHQ